MYEHCLLHSGRPDFLACCVWLCNFNLSDPFHRPGIVLPSFTVIPAQWRVCLQAGTGVVSLRNLLWFYFAFLLWLRILLSGCLFLLFSLSAFGVLMWLAALFSQTGLFSPFYQVSFFRG